jgi:hypothetical protein
MKIEVSLLLSLTLMLCAVQSEAAGPLPCIVAMRAAANADEFSEIAYQHARASKRDKAQHLAMIQEVLTHPMYKATREGDPDEARYLVENIVKPYGWDQQFYRDVIAVVKQHPFSQTDRVVKSLQRNLLVEPVADPKSMPLAFTDYKGQDSKTDQSLRSFLGAEQALENKHVTRRIFAYLTHERSHRFSCRFGRYQTLRKI